ncbi:hypothetical protein ACHMW4_12090 [Mesorhizobium sp. UC22_110]|uniref:hypothetical protein n=1 Tax=Mesorhizobium sp. UC22_110 TaxID=3374552 RepID=UPI00375832C2
MLHSPSAGMAPEERVTRIMNMHRRDKEGTALSASLSIVHQTCSVEAAELLSGFDAAWMDYAAASVYAALMGKERRKKLGAYFTRQASSAICWAVPPTLVSTSPRNAFATPLPVVPLS